MPLTSQDRSLWDQALIAEGTAVLARREPGPYQLQAAIIAVHTHAARFEDTDWPQIAALYRELTRWDPSPVIEINRAAAVGMADGPRAGLAILEPVLISGTSRPKRRSTPPMLTCLSARVRPTRPLQPGHEPLRQPGTRRSARNYSAAAAKLEASSASPGAVHALFREPGQVTRSLPGRAEPARVLSLRGLPGARIGAGCWGRSGSWPRSGCPKG